MTKSEALELLSEKIEAMTALQMAGSLINWDAATLGVPKKSLPARSASMGWLEGEHFRYFISADTLEAIETLEACETELSEHEQLMVRELGLEYRKLKAVPEEEVEAFGALVAEAQPVWETAREKRDFEMIQPYYEKILIYQRKLCDWYGYENHPYNALLNDYERGANVEMLDGFFTQLRKSIVPLLKKIIEKNNQPAEIKGNFSVEKQKELTAWLVKMVGYDLSRGKIGEVEHPFCTTITRNDVRITTKYHEDNVLSSIYSIIHECGHAIYEQNMAAELDKYYLGDCASMGIHESQSRLYENMIGRSRPFAAQILPELRKSFDFFADWNEDMLYRAINVAKPSLIRIEADELTYALHVMVRYELEKALISGEIEVADLPKLWADKYEELIGVRPSNLAEGVLQDVHWSAGLFGYFPTYAVGTAYGVQLLNTMKKTVDIDKAILNNDLSPITAWLTENVHKHGKMLTPAEILEKATGEPFNAKYYVEYLAEKFTDLYL